MSKFPVALARLAFGCGLAAAAIPSTLTAQAGTLSVVHSFTGRLDGALPNGSLKLNAEGDLFGKTVAGAAECPDGTPHHGCGTVYRIKPDGTFTTLTDFTGARAPAAGLSALAGHGGVLYGSGYTNVRAGAIFSIAEDGTGFSLLHAFGSPGDGKYPTGKILSSPSGILYGVTYVGGRLNDGTIFGLAPGGAYTVEYSFDFKTGGAGPNEIVQAPSGILYGSTLLGPRPDDRCPLAYRRRGCGVIYAFDPSNRTYTTLHRFGGHDEGAFPLLGGMDDAGNLYGITLRGGSGGDGTLFEMHKTKAGFAYRRLWSFDGGTGGASPVSPPSVRGDGTLVGTTHDGPFATGGAGVLYMVHGGSFTPLVTFTNDSNGGHPATTPIMDDKGVIYGTTSSGGLAPDQCKEAGRPISGAGCGVVFRYAP